MTDNNRGAYTPQSEAPLAFDARRSGGPGGGRPLPLTLIISAVVLAVIVIALIAFLMRQPDGSGGAKEGQTIDAMKSAPETATPVTDPRPGLQVYTEGQPAPVDPTFTPPPEQPGLRPTMPTQATMPPSATPTAAPVTTTVAAPKTAPRAAADPLAALTVAAAPKATPAPVAPAPTPAPVAPKAAPAPVAAAPAPKAAPSGPASVQIGAFSTNAQAEKGFNDVAGMFPGQMAGKTKRVEAIQRDGETLLRTSVGGFASRADAEAFCAQLQSRGKTCLVR